MVDCDQVLFVAELKKILLSELPVCFEDRVR